MTRLVCERGRTAAEEEHGVEPELLSFRAKTNVLTGKQWTITGDWTFEIAPHE